jgi:hypothetical protein
MRLATRKDFERPVPLNPYTPSVAVTHVLRANFDPLR